jgi:DNA-binding transcriptional regulator YhcF (GntR family)
LISQQIGSAREKCRIVTIRNTEGSWRPANVRAVTRLRSADVASMLRRRIQFGLHLGQMHPGDRLPSLRAAASEFGVDQRSVLAAYRELEAEGIVEMRPRSGIYVAGDTNAAPRIDPSARWMSDIFLQGFAHGVPPVSLGSTLADAVRATTLVAACLECNADQMLWLSSQLREEFGIDANLIDESTLDTEAAAARLAESHLIVTTAFHAGAARALGEQFGLPVVVATAGPDGSQLRAELSRGPVYFIGTDQRYAQKLLAASASSRWMANLRPIVIDGQTPANIPDDGPVLVTRAAAELLGEPLPRGATVLHYPFSSETRAELIAIMLSAFLKTHEAKATPPAPAST